MAKMPLAEPFLEWLAGLMGATLWFDFENPAFL